MSAHRVVALVSAPQGSFELGCVAGVFNADRYRFTICAERPGPIRTVQGFDLIAPSGLRTLDHADTSRTGRSRCALHRSRRYRYERRIRYRL